MERFSSRRLREQRERAGLRREAVALEVGRSADMIGSYEQPASGHVPPVDVLERLAEVLDCQIADLFERNER